ncbi:efflux RND transporter permease subunit [Pseudoalteromonas sp. MMG013]|uniref:efflux RND transporter permease subunit n=1 Tax=Pseudoalteromonas sp. MMG013 TaxID=2822687 RepID=UPI001B3704AE|nr:CusA/CzcA family heavy metal efflux RND transporter [Pseudoalteromonas sp. MMG013]MBQ4860125.1 efflux RND transporter permease subunit [Pseudoalteromonas sp. MMG013]
MLNRLVSVVIEQRVLVIGVFITVLVLSVFQANKLNLDAFPDVTNVQVAVNTQAPGLGAEEVEKLITYPIEAVMYALPDVEQVRSISKTGLSGVTVVFKEGVDIYFARQLVFERLQEAKNLIPDGIGTPQMGPNTSGLGQIFQYVLKTSPDSDIDLMTLRSLNDWLVKRLLMPIDGVTDVLSFGGQVKQYQVHVSGDKLLSYGLSLQQLMTALSDNNQNAGGWYLPKGAEQVTIRGSGWFDSDTQGLEQIAEVPVKVVDGTVVKISDVGTVKLGAEIRQGAVSMSSKNRDGSIERHGEVISGIVLKRIGANTSETINSVNDLIPKINQALPAGVTLIPVYNQAELVNAAVSTITQALISAFVMIVIVLFLFMLDVTVTFLVLLAIPISIAVALMLLSLFGISANLMSLGGLAVAIGMLVDGSVVMVERLFHQAQLGKVGFIENLKAGAQQVTKPILLATSIIIVVFLPLFSFEGVEAKLFEPMAMSIIFALISALFVALLLLPALSSFLLRNKEKPRKNHLLLKLANIYQSSLIWAFNHVGVMCVLVAIASGAALYSFKQLGSEFIPTLEEGTLNLRVTLAPSASLETSLELAPKIEQQLLTFPEITYALSRVGRPELGGDPEPVNNIEIYIGLKPTSQRQGGRTRVELEKAISKNLAQFPGVLFTFSQPIATRVDELLSGVKAQLSIKLSGPELTVLTEQAEVISQAIAAVEGTVDVAAEQLGGELQLMITPNRTALSRYGMSVKDVMSVVSQGIGGARAGQVIVANERYDIQVRLNANERNSLTAIRNIPVLSETGAWLTLSQVANIGYQQGPAQIRRDDVQRRIVIQANVSGRDMGGVVSDIQRKLNEVPLPSGYSLKIGGQFESQQRANLRLLFVIPMALVGVMVLLYLAFNSIKQTLIVTCAIPLSLIGGVIALYSSGLYLSVASAVGFITLFGVAVLNGVVLVDSINQQRHTHSLQSAVLIGAQSRLTPVLMTAITSVLGLLPMLLVSTTGAEIQKPLATVIIGGIFSATILTLYILPTLYFRSYK